MQLNVIQNTIKVGVTIQSPAYILSKKKYMWTDEDTGTRIFMYQVKSWGELYTATVKPDGMY